MDNITVVKDYPGNELHVGDIVLYCERGSKYFTEGVVINNSRSISVAVLDSLRFENIRKKPNTCYYTSIYSECICRSTARVGDELINLTALGMRDKFDINE